MKNYVVKIIDVKKITNNVNRIITERPIGYKFIPGQSTIITEYKEGKVINRPYSFTGLTNAPTLEFLIKEYPENNINGSSVKLKKDDKLLIGKAQGNIQYKGMGTFIAGGTGIIPFIAIFRDLKQKKDLAGNKLIYSEKTYGDLILGDELEDMLGIEFIKVFTKERYKKFYFGRIDKDFLRMEIVDFVQNFYVCGPREFIQNVVLMLKEFGVEEKYIIYERNNILVTNFRSEFENMEVK
jgi:ferredoxin-NADP reductase